MRLSLACDDYDRTRALRDGRITPEGIDLTYISLPAVETFFRMLRHREFDVAEMSLSSYVLTLFDAEPSFVGIPVFPSRMFRHSCIFVHARSGIRAPDDLQGRVVGCPEYQMTAGVWIRGILSDDFGVAVESVRYRTGGLEEPGRPEKRALALPSQLQVEPIPPDRTLSDMLLRGEIDALYTTRTPSCFTDGHPEIVRLFPDYQRVEGEYHSRTGIFPIMHLVVLRREIHAEHPWIARELIKAFTAAKAEALASMDHAGALRVSLPWLIDHIERTRETMGVDFWPYGLEPNRHALETFLRYSFEQGLSPRRLAPEDLFVI